MFKLRSNFVRGLAAAHEKGVLHRDLKPANIMIDGRGQVRITDFGLAKLVDDQADGEVAGTPAYMAPEQLREGQATIQSDLYALGLILHEVFTGEAVNQSANAAELLQRQQDSSSKRIKRKRRHRSGCSASHRTLPLDRAAPTTRVGPRSGGLIAWRRSVGGSAGCWRDSVTRNGRRGGQRRPTRSTRRRRDDGCNCHCDDRVLDYFEQDQPDKSGWP